MTQIILIWAIVVGLSAVYGFAFAGRWGAVAATIIIGLLSAYGFSIALGYPKPLWAEIHVGKKEIKVLAAAFDEGKAIYIFTEVPWSPVPHSYSLPWNTQQADQMYGQLGRNQKTGQGTSMTVPFGPLTPDDTSHEAYPTPVPPAPTKE